MAIWLLKTVIIAGTACGLAAVGQSSQMTSCPFGQPPPSRSSTSNRANWHRQQQLQSNQLGNGHKLAQLSFQRCSTNIGTEQLHWNHLCQRQISKVGRKYKGGEIKAFADAINEKAKILTCGAKPPLKSALSAYHALQNVVQSCPQQTFAFAGQKWNRLRQTMAK